MSSFTVPATGELIADKYRVEGMVGSGGMGVVLAATHVELGHMVALKVMRPESSPYHAERFRREARIVAKLRNEHVARVTDFGQLADGSPFVVMDYLEGRDLDAELKEVGMLPVDEAVGHVLCACEAIAEAHAHGIVHRDIKPKNLFLARRAGGLPVLKVLDFGLAKIGPREDPSITGSQDIFGSPAYMAPEQMRSAKDADARSDIWALGVTLYELIAGEGPFEASSVAEICAMVLKDPAPPLRAKRAQVPAGLAKVVHRCLAKNPNERFATVVELARELEPFAPPARAGAAKRIEAIATEPRSAPSLPPAGRTSGSDPGASSDSAPTRIGGNSEELTVEMETSIRRAADASPNRPARRRAVLVASSGAVALTLAAAAALVTREERSPSAAPMPPSTFVPATPAPPSTIAVIDPEPTATAESAPTLSPTPSPATTSAASARDAGEMPSPRKTSRPASRPSTIATPRTEAATSVSPATAPASVATPTAAANTEATTTPTVTPPVAPQPKKKPGDSL